MSRDPQPTPRITERDRTLLSFAAEHRFLLAGHAARLLDVGEVAVGRRLHVLRDAGLLAESDPFAHETPAYGITLRGLRMIGSDLSRPPALDLGLYAHDTGVAWLAVGAHRGVFGELSAVIGERRMRSEDRRADRDPDAPPHGVRLGGGDGGRLHYPDLVLLSRGGHRIALELELTRKTPARRERILAACAADRRLDAVVYLTPTPSLASAVERSAQRVGAADVVSVQRFGWPGGRAPGDAPPPTRAPARTRGRLAGHRSPGRRPAERGSDHGVER